MAKRRSPTKDWLAYLAARTLSCVMLMMPLAWSTGLTRWLSQIAFRLDRKHREIALANIRFALPEITSESQRIRLLRVTYEHFGLMLLEMLLLVRKIRRSNWHRHVTPTDPELWQKLARGDRAFMLVTGHHGNWELSAHWPGLIGIRGHMVMRPIDNPYANRLMTKMREHTGGRVVPKNGEAALIRDALANGGAVFTACDQDAGARGLFVDFFGRPASSHKALAVLALRQKAPIVVGGMERTGGFLQYTVRTTDVIDPADYAKHPDAVRAITQRMMSSLERWVRHNPSQYLWLHRRWKHQPLNGELKAA